MVEAQDFKSALAQLAAGVTVVTTFDDSEPQGMTVSAFTSVCVDPATVLVCIGKKARSHEAISNSGRFAVNILGEEQRGLGGRFAGFDPTVTDRFVGVDVLNVAKGGPVLAGSLAWLDCEVEQTVVQGDHSVFFGRVIACGSPGTDKPLMYFDRAWRGLASEPLK